MNLYFDTCSLNRLTDDQSQSRVRQENEAVVAILDLVTAGTIRWVASDLLVTELSGNPHTANRRTALSFLALATRNLPLTSEAIQRGTELRVQGFGLFDSFHLAVAEQHGVEWLVTVDDRFINRAAGRPPQSRPLVINPVDWLRRRHEWHLQSSPNK